MSTKNLSVFFPCVNEQGNIEDTVKKAVKVLQNLDLNYEIIIVNDGSTDQTAKVIEKLEKENTNIRSIHHPKNLGYGEALKSGFYGAKYDTIVYTDGDGQFDFSQIDKFLEKIETNDVVIGYRIKRQDPFFRILFAKGWGLALFFFFRLQLKDVDCGFKMIKRSVLQKIDHLQSQRGAMINAELAIKAKKGGFKVTQVGVNHYPRLAGRSTGANIKVIFKSFIDLFRLWWKLKKEKVLFLTFIAILVFASFLKTTLKSTMIPFLVAITSGRNSLISGITPASLRIKSSTADSAIVTSPDDVAKAIVFSRCRRPKINCANERLTRISRSPKSPMIILKLLFTCAKFNRLSISRT